MRIVFMGTPDFAAKSLESLIEKRFDVVGVFTQPDKPVGRKHILTPSDVKVCAQNNGISVYQPESMRTKESAMLLKSLKPDICVVVAYGKILPKNILEIPKHGCINVHASLLPKYRGASPIQWSIFCGEKKTGVSTMQLDEGMDTGDILLQESTEIAEDECVEELWDRLSIIGSDLLIKTLNEIENGTLNPIKQDEAIATYAPIISKSDGEIDWTKSAYEINCKVRGLHAWPVAYTHIDGKMLKIFSAQIINNNCDEAGKIISKDSELIVSCGEDALKINELQLEGSKRMKTTDFLRGKKISDEKL